MLKYTVAAFHKTVDDLARFAWFFTIISQSFMLIYSIYNIAVKSGILAVNIILGAMSIAYLIFYLLTYDRNDRESRKLRVGVANTYKFIRLSVNAFSIAVMAYGLYFATSATKPMSIVLLAVMLVFWVVQLIINLAWLFARARFELIMDALRADFEPILEAKRGVTNAWKIITGDRPVEKEEIVSEKNKSILKKQIEKDKQRKREEKQTRKEESDNWFKRIKRTLSKEDCGGVSDEVYSAEDFNEYANK